MKLFFHLFIFALGAGAGIWWSASHPAAAADVATGEQQEAAQLQAAVSQARIELLQKFLASSSSPAPDSGASSGSSANSNSNDTGYQRMLSDEQQKLAAAKKQLGN